MESTIPEKAKHGLSFPAILALLFVVNGIIALALVLIFSRFYGVSLVCIQAILILTALSLTVWATHQILTARILQNGDSDSSSMVTEWGSFGMILIENWRVMRDGISDSSDASLSERFANSFGTACVLVGSVVCICSEGAISWPHFSPVTDLLGSMLLLIIVCYLWNCPVSLRRMMSLAENSFGAVCRAIRSSPSICLGLFLAWNFFTAAYGIRACLPFAIANDLPLVPTFFVLSVIPTFLYGLIITILLAPSLAAFCEAQLDSTGF